MTTKIRGKTELPPPWEPAEFDPADIGAIKALVAGVANDMQQRRVVDWLIKASGIDKMTFRPGGEEGRRATDFAEGKRFVALQFFTLSAAVMPQPSRGSTT